MRKIFFSAAGVVAVALVFTLLMAGNHTELQTVTVGYGKLKVEIADSYSERERGLMWRTRMPYDRGMLFLFDKARVLSFWNKNTLIPLDIIWILKDSVVGIDYMPAMESNAITTVSSKVPADKVLEVNAGWAKDNAVVVGGKINIK